MDKPVVLLADDNEPTCTLVSALLRKHFIVEVAGDGNEAIEKLRSREYAVVLLDLLMPGADGYAVLDFIRDERSSVLSRTVVMTASVTPREMERVRTYAIWGVVPKPFDIEELLQAVKSCAGRRGDSFASPALITGGMLLLLEVLRRV